MDGWMDGWSPFLTYGEREKRNWLGKMRMVGMVRLELELVIGNWNGGCYVHVGDT